MSRTLIYALLLLPFGLAANNIEVENISLTDQDVGANTIMVTFDLSWDNSWRINSGPSNWDAAWVFVKYRNYGSSWQHLKVNYNDGVSDGHNVPSQATIRTTSDQMGCFIYRSTEGTGDFVIPGVQLLWNYGAQSLTDDASIEIKVFAIEMVYIPQAPFSLGNGVFSNEVNRFYKIQNLFSTPFQITSESAITVGTATGNLYYSNQAGSNGGDQMGPVPAAFPKGYDAFYCMKYEASQGQYVAFFNTLTEIQQDSRDLSDEFHKNSDGVVGRNGFSYVTFQATTVHPDIPVNYVNTKDALAYMDWAGMRPLSEFEFEKTCRGTAGAKINEYAWGTSEIGATLYTLINEGTPSELISNKQSEEPGVVYQPSATGLGGPMRCGIVAASAINKNRTESGATYYGVMEMSGNLYERLVSVGTPDGRTYTGLHGNGVLQSNGDHNVANWPGTTTGAIGYRGGSYANGADFIRVSDRYDAANPSDITNSRIGFRAARTLD